MERTKSGLWDMSASSVRTYSPETCLRPSMMAPPYPSTVGAGPAPGVTGGTDGFVIALLGDDDDFITGIQLVERLLSLGSRMVRLGPSCHAGVRAESSQGISPASRRHRLLAAERQTLKSGQTSVQRSPSFRARERPRRSRRSCRLIAESNSGLERRGQPTRSELSCHAGVPVSRVKAGYDWAKTPGWAQVVGNEGSASPTSTHMG